MVGRLFGLLGITVLLSFGFGAVAHAADYPPTTSNIGPQGSTVPISPSSVSPATASSQPTGGLPFTGGNDANLVWIAVAGVGAGTCAAWAFRRRTHHA
jgi:hypothetical protein